MLSQDEVERDRYNARLKWERDQRIWPRALEDAKKEHDAALREGRHQGELIGRIHVCERLLKTPLTPTEELAAWSLEQLRLRANSLEQQLGIADS